MKGKYLGWWCIQHISEYYLQKPFGFVRYFLLLLSVLDTKKNTIGKICIQEPNTFLIQELLLAQFSQIPKIQWRNGYPESAEKWVGDILLLNKASTHFSTANTAGIQNRVSGTLSATNMHVTFNPNVDLLAFILQLQDCDYKLYACL